MRSHRIPTLFAFIVALTPACEELEADGFVPLSDPETGAEIGVKDLSSGEYLFHDGPTVPADNVERALVGADSTAGELLADAVGALAFATPPPNPMLPDDDFGSGGTSGNGTWADGECYTMQECNGDGCYRCEGCCLLMWTGAYWCWEECTEFTSTKTGGSSGSPMM